LKPTLTFLTVLLLAPLTTVPAVGAPKQNRNAAQAADRKPNLLIVHADDLGYVDVQCYNPDRGRIPTPHLDKLAAQGIRFTDGHSSSGVCTPSRYTLLTGRYHWRTKLQSGIVSLWGGPLIAPDRVTIGPLAKQHGYRTACIGKWHLGWDWPIPEDRAALFKEKPGGAATATEAHRAVWSEVFSQPIGSGPVTRGFDSYFGTDVPNHPPFCFIENDRTVGVPSDFLNAELLKNNQASIQGPALKNWTLEPILPALGDRAVKFIADSASKKDPFLIYLPFTSPHTPLSVNDEWKGKSGLNLYADFVMEIAPPGSGGWGKGGDQSQPVQLYNLANDLGETKNLAAAQPEKLAEMHALLEKLITDGRSTPGAKQPNDVAVKRHPAPVAAKAKTQAKAAK
jgi:arylsulfatase A-like enzyme